MRGSCRSAGEPGDRAGGGLLHPGSSVRTPPPPPSCVARVAMPSTRPCCPFERLTLPMRLSAPRTLIAREHMPRAPAPLIEGDLTARSRRDCAPLPPVCLAGLDVRQRRSDNAFVHVQAGGGARGQVSLQRCVPAYLTSHVPLRTSHASLAASCDAVARRPSRRIHAVWRVGLTPARARARATLPQAGRSLRAQGVHSRIYCREGTDRLGSARMDPVARVGYRRERIGGDGSGGVSLGLWVAWIGARTERFGQSGSGLRRIGQTDRTARGGPRGSGASRDRAARSCFGFREERVYQLHRADGTHAQVV